MNEEEQINEILQMNDHDMENSSNNSLHNDSDRVREQRIQRLRQFGRQAANEAQNQGGEIQPVPSDVSSSNSSPARNFTGDQNYGQLLSHSSDEESHTSNEEEATAARRTGEAELRALGISAANAIQEISRAPVVTQHVERYPISQTSDIDENEDVVSINDSLNVIHQHNHRGHPHRLTEIGTIQSARRAPDPGLSATRRGAREEQKTNATQNIEELFKCFICFGKIEDAVICPSCSKLCCRSCIRKWIIEQRQQCPHCRSSLQVHQLVSCSRFVQEITEHIEVLNKNTSDTTSELQSLADGTIIKNGAEICQEHGNKMEYFCQTCQLPICSDCAMFGGDTHKDHKFLKLADVYQKHCDVIKKEALGLKKRLKELTQHMNEVQRTIEKVTKAKEEKSKEIENFVENI